MTAARAGPAAAVAAATAQPAPAAGHTAASLRKERRPARGSADRGSRGSADRGSRGSREGQSAKQH
eukprot:8682494-Alexandrium_andersonii.AAC.1